MSKVTRVWRIYVADQRRLAWRRAAPNQSHEKSRCRSDWRIYEVKADTHEEAMQKHNNGESEYITDGDGYEAPDGVDLEIELHDEYEEDND